MKNSVTTAPGGCSTERVNNTLHYVLCTVVLTITTLGKIKCIFYKVIVNR